LVVKYLNSNNSDGSELYAALLFFLIVIYTIDIQTTGSDGSRY